MNDILTFFKKNIPLLAILSSVGYLVSYFYQLAFSAFYGYPEEYVMFDLVTALKSLSLFFVCIAMIASICIFISSIKLKKIIPPVVFFLTGVIFVTIFGVDDLGVIFYKNSPISLLSVISFFIIGAPFSMVLIDILDGKKLDVYAYGGFIIMASMMVFTVPTMLGKLQAYSKTEYYSLNGRSEYILLASSGDGMVFGSCVNGFTKYLFISGDKNLAVTPVGKIKDNVKVRDCFYFRNKQ
ncbi:TPA: hypothetical protein OT143_001897 [Enterobacter kobei]|nr:hypothetical protein [Enterobacter kobei]